MNNLWYTDGNQPLASWDAVLSPQWQLEDLLTWTQGVVNIGTATRVLVPVRIPQYQALGGGATDRLLQGLVDRFRLGTVDLLEFASFRARHQGNLIHTRIAVADQDGEVREFMAARASELPESVWQGQVGRPDGDDESQFFLNVRPIGLMTADRLAELGHRSCEIAITFSLNANIWFPWIPQPNSIESGFNFDNRPLANIHTPYLNVFLAEVRRLTESMGGRWEFEALAYQPMVLEAGIDLAWLPPSSNTFPAAK